MIYSILALWFLMLGVSAGGFGLSLFQERRLWMTRVFLAYCVAVNSGMLAFWFLWPASYYKAYLVITLGHNLLLFSLGVQILCFLLPRWRAVTWICLALPVAAIPTIWLPLRPITVGLATVSSCASFAGGIAFAALFFGSVQWTKESRMATAGAVCVLAGDIPSLFPTSGHRGPVATALLQLAPIVGLILLSLAGTFKGRTRTHRDQGPPPEIPHDSASARHGHAA